MEGDELFERVRRTVAEVQELPLQAVMRETRVIPRDVDSLEIVELVMAFEELNQIEIPEGAAEGMTMERLREWTVGDLGEYLRDQLR